MPKDKPRTVEEVSGDIRDWQAMLKTAIDQKDAAIADRAEKQLAGLRSELVALRQDQQQAPAATPVKVWVTLPPVEPGDKDEEADHLQLWEQGGGSVVRLMTDGRKERMPFKDLIAGEKYLFTGVGLETSNMEREFRRKVASTLEVKATLAVAAESGGNSHVHPNVIHEPKAGNRLFELDGVGVHRGGETEPDSVAYVVETALEPNVESVDKVLKGFQLFKEHAKDMEHFKTVTTFVPVLGGRLWSKDVIAKCDENSVWRVVPSGGGYKVEKPKAASAMLPGDGLKRTFATLAVQLARKLR